MRVSRNVKLAACAILLLGTRLYSQQAPAPPAAPDTPAIAAMIEAARKAAASEFTEAVHVWCEAPWANRVVGTTAYQKFVDVMAACTNVNLARRKP